MPRSNHIECRIYRGAAQITFGVFDVRISANHPQKNGLKHILGIGRIARNPVRGAEHHAVMRFIHLIEGRFDHLSKHLLLKTGTSLDYYT